MICYLIKYVTFIIHYNLKSLLMKHLSLLIFVTLTNLSNGIQAQSQPWEPNCVASNGTNLFIGTSSDGILLSDNSGMGKWVPKNNGLPIRGKYVQSGMLSYCSIAAICINEFKDVFALVKGIGRDLSDDIVFGGVYMSSNNGDGWTAKNNGFPSNCEITSLSVCGTNIFAGTVGHGVFKSSNNGNNWVPANIGLENTTIISLHVDGQNIYAGTGDGKGVVLSSNYGTDWREINNGLPLSKDNYEILGYHNTTSPSITTIVTSGKNIFCVINSGVSSDTNGIFLSSNNGSTWTSVNNGLPMMAFVNSLTLAGTDLFARTSDGDIYVSKNNGGLWTLMEPNWTCILTQKTTSLVASGKKLFAATECLGVFMSTNSGITWTKINNERLDPK